MADYETIKKLDIIIEQQAQIGNETIRALRAIEANQKERMVEERMGEEPGEEKEAIQSKPLAKQIAKKWPDRRIPKQEPEPEQTPGDTFSETEEDVQELSPEEYRELEAKQKKVL